MTEGARKPRDLSGLEEVLEDVAGFNFRSFRTFFDLVARPGQVFRAYALRETETYTPALRLWLGLTVVLALLSFFFGGQDDLIRQVIGNWPDAQRTAFLHSIDGRMDDFAQIYANTFSLLQPIIVGFSLGLTVFLIAALDRGLSWVARINLTFGVLATGSLLGLALFPILVRFPQLGLWSLIPIWMVYWLTLFRGAPEVLASGTAGRIAKATLISCVILVLLMIAGMITVGISMNHAVTSLQAAAANAAP
ncbi:DUF3667 domain-containing protein [uncultured Maricaulis sp.]|uniref:DUF3667 domain-containing protein n=1 Tax=uncultured Maricaulis sp. TaxID=174710 RepID=UPI00261F59FB|nr:DUF3667 domain-containing protein [uncultured Maricaulis sp.]